jgi:AsmA protein
MLRVVVGALVSVALVLAGGFFLYPRLVPERDVLAAVARALTEATGVEPRIAGPARLSLLPRPSIRLDSVRLDDGERAGVTAGALVATVRLAPLLSGVIEIGSITLERPRLALEVRADGVRVVGLPLYAGARRSASPAAPELHITEGTVELRNGAGDLIETLTGVEVALAWSTSGMTASGTFDWGRLPVTGTLVLSDVVALRAGNRSAVRLRLETEGLRYGFEGGIAFRGGPLIEGAMAVDGKSLRTILSWIGLEPPSRGGFGPFALKSKIALTPGALALSSMAIELDGNLSEGGVTLKRDGARAVLQGTLASESIDLTRYAAREKSPAIEAADWLQEPVNLSALDMFDLDLRLSARRVLIGKSELGRVAMTAALKGGRLTVAVGEAQVFGGVLRGTAALARGSAGGDMKLEANLADFNLEQGLSDLIGFRRLEGVGNLTVALESSGPTVETIVRGLAGEATLKVASGALVGINVEQILRRLDRNPLSGLADFRGGRTPFERIAATVRFVDGSASLHEIQIESALVRVTLTGSASIARRDLDLRGTATLLRPASAATGAVARGFELPFLLQGPWDSPLVLPDTDALIRRSGAAAPLLDAARAKGRGTVRSVIESLTGPTPAAQAPKTDGPGTAPAATR